MRDSAAYQMVNALMYTHEGFPIPRPTLPHAAAVWTGAGGRMGWSGGNHFWVYSHIGYLIIERIEQIFFDSANSSTFKLTPRNLATYSQNHVSGRFPNSVKNLKELAIRKVFAV